tara:strand:+ start:2276 stop:3850 length:1575 start_codon:yes stop_codon:yes gene_type:complete
MAYKFQIGQAALSGALEQAGEITFLNGKGPDGTTITRLKNLVVLEDGNVDVPRHNGTIGLMLGGDVVTSTAAELNLLDTAAAGTVVNSKAVIYSNAGIIQATDFKGPDGFDIGNATNADALNFAAAEITVKDGVDFSVATVGGFNYGGAAVTSTAAELNLLDTAVAGTVVNSKAVIYSAGGIVQGTGFKGADDAEVGNATNADLLVLGAANVTVKANSDLTVAKAGGLNLADGAVTSTAAELNLLDGSSAATVVNSKGVIYGAAGQVNGTSLSASTGITGSSIVIGLAGTTGATITNTGVLLGTQHLAVGPTAKVSSSAGITGSSLQIAAFGVTNTGYVSIPKLAIELDADGENIIGIGDLGVDGAANFNGAVTLGNATGDDITATGRFASSLIPKQDSTSDLGSDTLRWRKIYADEIVGADTTLDVGHYGASPYVTTISSSTDFALIKSGSTTGLGGAVYTLPSATQGKVLHVKLSGSQANVNLKAAANDCIEDGVAAGSIFLESTGSAVTLVAMNNEHWYII